LQHGAPSLVDLFLDLTIFFFFSFIQNLPFYRIFVADSRAPRDGKHLEVVGHYDPAPGKDGHKHLALDIGRVRSWLALGAQPSKPVAALLGRAGVAPPPPRVAPAGTIARGVKNPDKKTSGGKEMRERRGETLPAPAFFSKSSPAPSRRAHFIRVCVESVID